MRCLNLNLQSHFLPGSLRQRPVPPGIESAGRYVHNLPHERDGVLESQFFHHRVPGSDSFAKYAAAFFNISRSILTSTSSFFVRASSISISVRGLRVLPICPNLPAL